MLLKKSTPNCFGWRALSRRHAQPSTPPPATPPSTTLPVHDLPQVWSLLTIAAPLVSSCDISARSFSDTIGERLTSDVGTVMVTRDVPHATAHVTREFFFTSSDIARERFISVVCFALCDHLNVHGQAVSSVQLTLPKPSPRWAPAHGVRQASVSVTISTVPWYTPMSVLCGKLADCTSVEAVLAAVFGLLISEDSGNARAEHAKGASAPEVMICRTDRDAQYENLVNTLRESVESPTNTVVLPLTISTGEEGKTRSMADQKIHTVHRRQSPPNRVDEVSLMELYKQVRRLRKKLRQAEEVHVRMAHASGRPSMSRDLFHDIQCMQTQIQALCDILDRNLPPGAQVPQTKPGEVTINSADDVTLPWWQRYLHNTHMHEVSREDMYTHEHPLRSMARCEANPRRPRDSESDRYRMSQDSGPKRAAYKAQHRTAALPDRRVIPDAGHHGGPRVRSRHPKHP